MKTLTILEFISEAVQRTPEPYAMQYKRRVVKTKDPKHLAKGYRFRIMGKQNPMKTIKLFKTKPTFEEFVKELKRVAAFKFG